MTTLPQSYIVGTDDFLSSKGYTKQYVNPWDTSYNYVDASGNVLGKGYDSYEDAIRKLAFTSGLQTYAAQSAVEPFGDYFFNGDPGQGQPWSFGSAATPEQFGYRMYAEGPNVGLGLGDFGQGSGESGLLNDKFNTKQELYDFLLSRGDLDFDSKEKYGRELTEGQLQNMYARYASGALTGAVPDWTYHRAAYDMQNTPWGETAPPAGGYRMAGEQALVGSTPVFGVDGKIVGYKINANPEHINLADTSGRVQSSTSGATNWDPSLKNYAYNMGDGTIFVKAEDIGKVAYNSTGTSTYSKDPNFFDKYMPGIIQSAALGGMLTGLGEAAGFSDLLSKSTKAIVDATGATGDVAKAITSGIKSAVYSVPKTILTGGSFSDVLTNAVTGGLTSGVSSIVGNTVAGAVSGVPTGATDDQYTSVDTASTTDRFPLTGTVAGAAAGTAGGIINASLTGGDVGTGALTGLIGGGAAGGVGVDLGAGQAVGNTVGNIAGGLVNQALQPDPVAPPAAPVTTPTATPPATETDTRTHDYALNWGDSPSFATLLPQTSRPAWGTRLIEGRAA